MRRSTVLSHPVQLVFLALSMHCTRGQTGKIEKNIFYDSNSNNKARVTIKGVGDNIGISISISIPILIITISSYHYFYN